MNKDCHKQFSVKTFSIFEDSAIPLDKWLTAIWLVVNCKNGISSYELHRDLGVTQKSAWFMLHRIRLALKNSSFERIGSSGGPIEADECYIGGKPKNMHASRRAKLQANGQKIPKPAVFGMLDRDTRQVRTAVFAKVDRGELMCEILNNVQHGVALFTDSHRAYDTAQKHFIHSTVNHMNEYVRGQVHTNGIENFWSLLKRSLSGTYVSVEPFHLDAYVDEQAFRFNNRKTKENPVEDSDRFVLAVSQIAGKRLTYAELTGKVGETSSQGPF